MVYKVIYNTVVRVLGPNVKRMSKEHFLHQKNGQLHKKKRKWLIKGFEGHQQKAYDTSPGSLRTVFLQLYRDVGVCSDWCFEMGAHGVRNLSSFDEMKVQLWYQKWHYVSAPATAGCGPFINDSWLKLQLQEQISFFFFFFFFICKRNQKKEGQYCSGEQSSRNMPEGDVSVSENTVSPCHISVAPELKLKSPLAHISRALCACLFMCV